MTHSANKSERSEEPRLMTGIDGLDALLIGGFKLTHSKGGLILLIKGKPGTGKSTLALTIAKKVSDEIEDHTNHFPNYGGWRYFTCEQKTADIIAKAETFGLEIGEGNICDNSVPSDANFPDDSPHMLSRTTLMWAVNTMYQFISGKSEKADKDRKTDDKGDHKYLIVVDGLNLMSAEERVSMNMDWLIATLRKRSLLSIIVYEPLDGEMSQIDSMVDIIIQMKGEEFAGPPPYFLNKLCITKSRFQRCIIGWHQYKIFDKKGIVIFPSIHYYIHKSNFFDKEMKYAAKPWGEPSDSDPGKEENVGEEAKKAGDEQMKDESIIQKLLNQNIRKGSLTVLLGPRKTCKTLLSIDFLHAGSRIKESGLLISLIDNRETIIQTVLKQQFANAKEGTVKANQMVDKESLARNHLFHFRPGCITSDEFFYYVDQQMLEHKPKRVVLWDLTQIDFNYPLMSNDTMFFPAFVDYLKTGNQNRDQQPQERDMRLNSGRSDVSAVFISSLYCKLSKAAFTMADNVILLLRGENEDAENIFAYVDRVEGKPGTHYLWKIPLHNSDQGDEPIFEDPMPMPKKDMKDIIISRGYIEKFENVIKVIENSKI